LLNCRGGPFTNAQTAAQQQQAANEPTTTQSFKHREKVHITRYHGLHTNKGETKETLALLHCETQQRYFRTRALASCFVTAILAARDECNACHS
jgi:hypothetical protein